MTPPWCFMLPPSQAEAAERQLLAADALAGHGFAEVTRAKDYAALKEALLQGAAVAAWAPPFVCAQVESEGGRVILQAVRGASRTYRAALFARADRRLSLPELRGARAAWTEWGSMAGFLLPRALLRRLGLVPARAFKSERFLKDFPTCVAAVLDGTADVSAGFASSLAARQPRAAHLEAAGARAGELAVLEYTEDCPHDGVVLSPCLTAAEQDELEHLFGLVLQDSATSVPLYRALEVDHLLPAAPGAYARVFALVGVDVMETAGP